MKKSNYGYFPDKLASFVITDTNAEVTSEYVYQNKEILIKVDKFGPIYMQAFPPKDVMIFKRDGQERFSKWQYFITCENSTAKKVSAFSFPRFSEPVDGKITYSPEKAEYFYDYGDYTVKTTIAIPLKGSVGMMEVEIVNTSNRDLSFKTFPSMFPHVNKAAMAPWDKPEWYLRTCVVKRDGYVEFVNKAPSPDCIVEERRLITVQMQGKPQAVEFKMSRFGGNGSFDMPDGIVKGLPLAYDSLGEDPFVDCDPMVWYPAVDSAEFSFVLKKGESNVQAQIISLQDIKLQGEYDKEEAKETSKYLDKEVRDAAIEEVRKHYEELCSVRKVKTEDPIFDVYVNGFLPLQMHWVASLDRGWPTGMRGVRDASQDFTGLLYYDTEWPREIILTLLSRQRKSDGWMPRQVSDADRHGNHDLRPYVDGGAFLLELIYYYIAFSGDYAILNEKLQWLDSDEYSTVYEHTLAVMDYYLREENIGEHGITKVWGGDWMDSMTEAGKLGRGESVMLTGQVIICLKDMAELVVEYKNDTDLAQKYLEYAKLFSDNLNKNAWNEMGYYNAVFNDNGKWIFSPMDPDGVQRIYGPANYFAVASGAATKDKYASILKNVETLKSDYGYNLFWPGMDKYIDKVGRIASGDFVVGVAENGANYNHGSQGFLARMLGYMKEGDLLEQVLRLIMPFDQDLHPVELTQNAPYAIVNCYLGAPNIRHRAGMSFLTGSISMAVRAVYTWAFGIEHTLKGIKFQPAFKKGDINRELECTVRGKKLSIKYFGENVDNTIKVYIDGILLKDNVVPYDELKDGSTISIEFVK